jgi:hypothetical protein
MATENAARVENKEDANQKSHEDQANGCTVMPMV